jgi:hypothetical protein
MSNRQRLAEEEFGSYTLKDMRERKRQKKAFAESERMRIDNKKEATLQKKEAAATALKELTCHFDLCNPDCMCGTDVCPMLKYLKCESCNQIKKGLCKVRVCVDSRKAQLPLTLN